MLYIKDDGTIEIVPFTLKGGNATLKQQDLVIIPLLTQKKLLERRDAVGANLKRGM